MLARKIHLMTMLYGRVRIQELYLDESEARQAGYCADAHAYVVIEFGGNEPVGYKVLVRNVDGRREFCAVKGRRKNHV